MINESNNENNNIILQNLLDEYKENRQKLREMIDDLEKLKSKIDLLFPDKLDNRYIRFFEEKVKTISSFFNSILDIRKEINKSLSGEIQIRDKILRDDEEDKNDISKLIDIRKLAKEVDKQRSKIIDLSEKRKEN